MEADDVGPLVLSMIALVAMVFTAGILLVPVWSPEIVPVLAGAAFMFTLFAMIVGMRNAFRRREFVWIVLMLLFGPVGVLAYTLVKTTESGILASYLEELGRQTLGEADRK